MEASKLFTAFRACEVKLTVEPGFCEDPIPSDCCHIYLLNLGNLLLREADEKAHFQSVCSALIYRLQPR